MNNNQDIQRLKHDPKGSAITSFTLGIVSITPVLLVFLTITLAGTPRFYDSNISFGAPGDTTEDMIVFLLILPVVLGWPIYLGAGLIGLFRGIKGLKSTKKNLAIIGIILCIITSLSSFTFIFLIALFRKILQG